MRLLSILLISGLIISCERNSDGLICTEQFVTIAVEINNQSNERVSLDSVRVILLNDNRDITEELALDSFETGIYPIINDNFNAEAARAILNIHFKGYLGGELVIDELYKVGSDKCHITLIDGKQLIVI